MKCKKCGHRANSLQAMQKHYRKAHPGAMKRKKGTVKVAKDHAGGRAGHYGCTPHKRFCPHCGGFLGD